MALKASSEAGSAEQKRAAERKRNLLVLVHHYLTEHGYIDAAERLYHDAATIVGKFDVADNIDLGLIVGDYESYYEMRFDRKPKIVRKVDGDGNANRPTGKPPTNGRRSNRNGASDAMATGGRQPVSNSIKSQSNMQSGGPENDNSLGVIGTSTNKDSRDRDRGVSTDDDIVNKYEERHLRPPPQFSGDAEMKQLAQVISREIYQESPNVRFDDIVRLDEAKRLLVEAVQLPLKFPTLFTGILRPWKGILLHGPPGTGKTLLARAVATECNTTFFNISASTLVSKWRGDSEKLVRALFDLARHYAPSTVFLDEIDSILSSRNGDQSEHEASRRMKTELLIQMDGMKGGGKPTELVFVMAASNMPWDLDIAVLRRLEKRVLVSLPECEAREAMIRKHLESRTAPDFEFEEVAALTEGFSGADIELLCREAAMMPVRRLVGKLSELEIANQADHTSSTQASRAKRGAVGTAAAYVHQQQQLEVDVDALIRSDLVTREDMRSAMATTRPSSDGTAGRYEKWQEEFGSV
jgi:katanin p60 ATPase-containing subunit A1